MARFDTMPCGSAAEQGLPAPQPLAVKDSASTERRCPARRVPWMLQGSGRGARAAPAVPWAVAAPLGRPLLGAAGLPARGRVATAARGALTALVPQPGVVAVDLSAHAAARGSEGVDRGLSHTQQALQSMCWW